MDYQSVLNEVETWPIDDRIRLVRDMWDRLVDTGHKPELDENMKAEINSRIEVLSRELGSADALRFINQFTTGYGDYTSERDAMFGRDTLDQMISDIKKTATEEV